MGINRCRSCMDGAWEAFICLSTVPDCKHQLPSVPHAVLAHQTVPLRCQWAVRRDPERDLIQINAHSADIVVPKDILVLHNDLKHRRLHDFLGERENLVPLRPLVLLKVLCLHLVVSKVHLHVRVKASSDVHVGQVACLDHAHEEVLHLLDKVVRPSLLARVHPAANDTAAAKRWACFLELEVYRLLWTWSIHP
ncbi:hypothetical protein ZEAMMB73_Zm00001d006370 [Zea mays]|nr:hypothetical protein ZEAMMB73_Zm00001d006370 [Zea mays]ONM23620.1 hypothetical protein ZEAMMB73_Zm00001d006370 [Zea mays]